MKAYGNVITGTVGANGLDLPTQAAARPAHWPAKRDRTAWTSPIARACAPRPIACAKHFSIGSDRI